MTQFTTEHAAQMFDCIGEFYRLDALMSDAMEPERSDYLRWPRLAACIRAGEPAGLSAHDLAAIRDGLQPWAGSVKDPVPGTVPFLGQAALAWVADEERRLAR